MADGATRYDLRTTAVMQYAPARNADLAETGRARALRAEGPADRLLAEGAEARNGKVEPAEDRQALCLRGDAPSAMATLRYLFLSSIARHRSPPLAGS